MLAWHPPFSYMPANRLTPEWIGADLLAMIVYFNIILAVFNLIPLAPLDGFKVALGALPREMARSFARLEPYGPGILMAVLLVSYMGILGFGLWDILGPAVRAISLLVLGRPI
jgi:Zn-dependent protease